MLCQSEDNAFRWVCVCILCKKCSKFWWLHRKDATPPALQKAESDTRSPMVCSCSGEQVPVLWGIAQSNESRRKCNQDCSTGASVLVGDISVRCTRQSNVAWQDRSHPLLGLMSVQAPFWLCSRNKVSTWMRGRHCLQQGNWSRGRLIVDFSTVSHPATAYFKIIPSLCLSCSKINNIIIVSEHLKLYGNHKVIKYNSFQDYQNRNTFLRASSRYSLNSDRLDPYVCDGFWWTL